MKTTIITCDMCSKDMEQADVKVIMQVETMKFFGKKGQATPEYTESHYCMDCRDKLNKFIDDSKKPKTEEGKGD